MNENSNTQSGEYSFKEVLLTLRDYLRFLWSRKFFIVGVCALFIGLFVAIALFTRPKFPAILTFMVNEDEQGGDAINGILGQFGLGGSSEHNLDRILELSKSQRMTSEMIFDSITVAGESDYLGNHLINYLESEKDWGDINFLFKLLYGDDPLPLKGFRFSRSSISTFEPIEKKALKILHIKLMGTPDGGKVGLLTTNVSDDSGIMKLIASTHRQELSCGITMSLYNHLSEYYIRKSTEKHKHTYEIINAKVDSINNRLAIAQSNLASFVDRNQNVFRSKDKLSEQKYIMEIQKLTTMSAEAQKNLELADFTLKKKTPFIDIIDEPLIPLLADRPSFFQSLIRGLLLGLIISLGYLIIRKVLRDTLD